MFLELVASVAGNSGNEDIKNKAKTRGTERIILEDEPAAGPAMSMFSRSCGK